MSYTTIRKTGSLEKYGGLIKILRHILDTRNKKNLISTTPLNVALKALSFALKDPAEAFVLLLSK